MPAAGACDVRHSDLGIRGLQLRWVTTATHDVAVPPEFVALYCLPQLPDVVLRAFHRLLPHQGECGVLYRHTRFYRVVVLVFKEFFNPDINWLDFYNLMSGYVGIVCSVAFLCSAVYLVQRYRKENASGPLGSSLFRLRRWSRPGNSLLLETE